MKFRILHDETSGTTYEPWTDGHAVGFKVTRKGREPEFVYLNPSMDLGSEDPPAEPCVFVYIGPAGDPAADEAIHHYDVTRG